MSKKKDRVYSDEELYGVKNGFKCSNPDCMGHKKSSQRCLTANLGNTNKK